MKRLLVRGVMAITVLLFAATALPVMAAAAAPAPGPRALIEGFHGELLEIMKNAGRLGIAGRFARLQPEVAQRFDAPLMMALATGKHWRTAAPAERQRLAEAFRRFSAATYASRFSDFSGESFETVAVQPGPRQTQLVRTRINRPDDNPVALTYVTRASDADWRIVDVLVDDGISELAVRRSEYRSVLDSGGIEALIRLLERRTATLLGK